MTRPCGPLAGPVQGIEFRGIKKSGLGVHGDVPLAPAPEHLTLEPGYLRRHLLQFLR